MPMIRILTLKGFEEEFQEIKEYLDKKGLPYKYLEIYTVDEKSQLKNLYPQAQRFPVIIIDKKFIGSSVNDLIRWHEKEIERGELL